jgi:hypothetical protein
MWICVFSLLVLLCSSSTNGFAPVPTARNVHQIATSMAGVKDDSSANLEPTLDCIDAGARRRSVLSSLFGGALLVSGFPAVSAAAAEDDETFASIAARAAILSSDVGESKPQAVAKSDDPRTAYDFSLPVAGETIQFQDLVHQQYNSDGRATLKAILVVNMKEDDPTARKDIPEFISLASK